MDQTVDSNNNDAAVTKYSLRPRITGKKTTPEIVDEAKTARTYPKTKKGSQPLSKYRRRSANARERTRMREINEAFETLRRVVTGGPPVDQHGEKITKISTLRLAMKYITALSEALRREPAVESSFTYPLSNTNSSVKTVLPIPSVSEQPETVYSDTSSISSRSVSSNIPTDSRYQPFFGEQLCMKESNASFSSIRSTSEQSADILKPIEIQCCSFNDRNGRNQIVTKFSNLTVPSHCIGNAFNCSDSVHSFGVSGPTLQATERSGQEESSAPISEFDDCHTLLLSNIQSLPLQGIPLEELLSTR